ncbi:hypothetical protein CUMW_251080 [Citrus unshiu]|uniref:Uncharacterized protein n=1 Tax=Citrus unshiu TaxID=55188 RepID=A0A2H5QQ67_CITUN|nr:hypothetical protein CUMW_251080 [Citrus unshiu]
MPIADQPITDHVADQPYLKDSNVQTPLSSKVDIVVPTQESNKDPEPVIAYQLQGCDIYPSFPFDSYIVLNKGVFSNCYFNKMIMAEKFGADLTD